MLNIHFLQKKGGRSESYLLILFLAGEKVYGFAFEEENPDNKSALYVESIDPFLKDAISKIEKIIAKCEEDLGTEVYLQKTLLFLNSLYVTDSGSIREDFLKTIKKLFKDLDLVNLGYVNFHEVVSFHYGGKHKRYYFVEESVYDYTVYTFDEKKLVKTDKIAKSKDVKADTEEISKYLEEGYIVAFLYDKLQGRSFKIDKLIVEDDYIKLFSGIYLKNKEIEETAKVEEYKQEVTEKPALTDFPEAPGFVIDIDKNKDGVSESRGAAADMVKTSVFSKFKASLSFLSSVKDWIGKIKLSFAKLWVVGAFFLLLLAAGYLFFLHQAEIKLSTKKENFSSKIDFIIGGSSGIGKKFAHNFSLKTSIDTSGEKVVGEKAEGEVTIYNGSFEKREITTSDQLIAKEEVLFVVLENVTIPAATTSANLDAGVVTKVYGKKNIRLRAVNIGAEGNLNDGTKLLFKGVAEDELYALANGDFSGGFKKTVQVFSDADKKKLEKKALELVKKEVRQVFEKEHETDDFLFLDTLEIKSKKSSFSAEVDEEVDKVELTYSGRGEVYFIPRDTLINKVQKDKLTDKEFVEDTFTLKKIVLEKKNTGKYTYSAIAGGLVQRFIDKEKILKSIKGKLLKSAGEIIATERNIETYQIQTKPIPLPVMPWNIKNITFVFLN